MVGAVDHAERLGSLVDVTGAMVVSECAIAVVGAVFMLSGRLAGRRDLGL